MLNYVEHLARVRQPSEQSSDGLYIGWPPSEMNLYRKQTRSLTDGLSSGEFGKRVVAALADSDDEESPSARQSKRRRDLRNASNEQEASSDGPFREDNVETIEQSDDTDEENNLQHSPTPVLHDNALQGRTTFAITTNQAPQSLIFLNADYPLSLAQLKLTGANLWLLQPTDIVRVKGRVECGLEDRTILGIQDNSGYQKFLRSIRVCRAENGRGLTQITMTLEIRIQLRPGHIEDALWHHHPTGQGNWRAGVSALP